MALVPPPNTAGVVPPANAQNPPTLGDIANSEEYVKRLALSQRAQIPGATATNNDIGSAERYHQDVVITNTMMGPAPPQWLAQLMAAPPPWIAQFIANVNQNLANVNQTLVSVNQTLVSVNQTLVSVNQTLACLEAGQANARISRLNKLEMERNNGLIAYRAKRKVVVGDGTQLANAVLSVGIAPLAVLQVAPAVGTVIAPTINPNNITHHAILLLIQYYNTDFGIQQNDLIGTRWQRILNWLTTDV